MMAARNQLASLRLPSSVSGTVTGRELYDWIRVHRPEISHRVVFTMSDTQGTESTALKSQTGCQFIQKPFQIREFWEFVKETLVKVETTALRR